MRHLPPKLFPGADAVGRTVMAGNDPLQVVGIAPDTVYRSAIEQNAPSFLYVPLAQNYESGVTLHIRTAGDPAAQIPPLRRVLQEVDPQLVLGRPRVLSEEFTRSIGDQRMMATLVGLFGLLALVLAAIGLYGVMAHLAGQRTTEIGIRLALGAQPSSILKLMLTDGLRLVAIGSVIGFIGAFAGARYVQNQLFGVAPTDPDDLRRCLPHLAHRRDRRMPDPGTTSDAGRPGAGVTGKLKQRYLLVIRRSVDASKLSTTQTSDRDE